MSIAGGYYKALDTAAKKFPVLVIKGGMLQGGKIIEERQFRRRQDVSIGQDAKNTIVVPASMVPMPWMK